MSALVRLAVVFLMALVGLGTMLGPTHSVTDSVGHSYTYNVPDHDPPSVHAASERGPPGRYTRDATLSTLDYPSQGLQGCPRTEAKSADLTSRMRTEAAQGGASTGTTTVHAGRSVTPPGGVAQLVDRSYRGSSAALQPWRVAAKTADELASGMGRTGSALTKSDPFHRSVSWVVDNPAAERFAIRGGDGVGRELYQLPGEVNGKSGVFEWIIDRSGSNPFINHQRFIPGGSITGVPNQVVP